MYRCTVNEISYVHYSRLSNKIFVTYSMWPTFLFRPCIVHMMLGSLTLIRVISKIELCLAQRAHGVKVTPYWRRWTSTCRVDVSAVSFRRQASARGRDWCRTFLSWLFKQTQLKGTRHHTGYPETTNATDNNKHGWNQQAGIGCKYLSGNNLPRIKLIRGNLLPDRYLLSMTAYWFQ